MSAKIAYVINSVEGGGAALPVPSIAEVLRRQGAQVRVFALTRRDGRALPAMAAAGLDPLVRDGGEGDHLSALRWLVRETRAWGATHLWTSLSRATLLGLIAGPTMGLPVIAWQHAAYLKPWNRRLLRLLQRNALLWVADSHSVERLTLDRLKVSPDRLETWPIFAADADQAVAQPWRPGEPLRLGSLGRLHPVKGYDILAEALASLRREGFRPEVPIEVTVAGEGMERARLEAAIWEDDLPLKLTGYVSDPQAYLQGLHLYLQPSRSEGFCIGVHQALAAGLPVIASRVGEPAMTIREGETGSLCPPGDAQALAIALRRALSSPAQLARMGRQARSDVLDRFSRARFEEAGTAIWHRIAAASGTARS